MSNHIVEQFVDIYECPSLDPVYCADARWQITIGDLHANTMKLMFLLVKHGIVKNLGNDDYAQLVEIYTKSTEGLTREDLDQFDKILDSLDFNSMASVRLIGDELCDRGCNDYFTLKVLNKLKQNKIPVDILLSNHSVDFLEATEKQGNFIPHLLKYEHSKSMFNLNALVDEGLVMRKEVLEIANDAYKPALKLVAYTLNEDRSNITIFSHAGIGLNTIQELAVKLGVTYTDDTASKLAATIEQINEKFQTEYVAKNKVHTLYSQEKMMIGYDGRYDLTGSPLEMLMWNRSYNKIERPITRKGYSLTFVHGHDPSEKSVENIFNIDNDLGKSKYSNRGTYTVLCSHENELSQQEMLKIAENRQSTLDSRKKILNDIGAIISAFSIKMSSISHQYGKARDAADSLLLRLNTAKEAYETKIDSSADNWVAASAQFKSDCEDAILSEGKILENDLGWGDYLRNMLIALTEAVARVFSAGKYSGFFTPVKSESSIAVDKLSTDLNLDPPGRVK